MKRLLLLIALLAIPQTSAQTGCQCGSVTIAVTNVAVQLSTASPPIKATGCTIRAKAGNANPVYLAFSSAVTTSTGTALNPGSSSSLAGDAYTCMPRSTASSWSMGQFWITGTSGDGVQYTWE